MILANGQFLPAFLQQQTSALRQYLPIWSAPIITAAASGGLTNFETTTNASINQNDIDDSDARAYDTQGSEGHLDKTGSAIHASPAAHHLAKNTSLKARKSTQP